MPYSKRKKIIYEMNVIPYIDVMLVLLLVFMIAAPLMYQGLEVNLPETTSKEINLNDFKEPLIIDVNENKKIFVIYGEKFKQLVTMKDLPKVIQSIYKNKKINNVYIRGDKNVSYQKIIETISILNNSGITNIGLITVPINVKK
jgi:biopolymer transport protein TolR|tara:strand:- start:198 stop:629 length:432 start_codon:yes stop_codon:yes gene_type:complete